MTRLAPEDSLLIVEDDVGLRSQLRWNFDKYNVVVADDRESAIAAIRQYEPAVVLQDLGLPPDAEGVSEGFKTILAGPDHAFYREFCPAPGHQLGFNDVKTIEVAALVRSLGGGPKFMPDFREAWEIQRVVDAIVRSARERRWFGISEV